MESIIQGDRPDRCYICGAYGRMDIHHMLPGCRRHIAEKYGLTVHVCRICHGLIHDEGLYLGQLERQAEMAFVLKYGYKRWVDEVNKNYLSEEEINECSSADGTVDEGPGSQIRTGK